MRRRARLARPLPALREVLDRVADSPLERERHVANDPLGCVRRYASPRDQEVVGIYASSLAYGKVSLFLPVLEALLARLGPSPAARSSELAGEDPGEALDLVEGLTYRMTRPRDLADLVRTVGASAQREGGLEALFLEKDHASEPDVAPALGRFRDALLAHSPRDVERDRLGLRRLLPDVKKGSASKRLFLYLRWMVRQDAVDLGAWKGVSPARLVMPLDAHVFRFAHALGLTTRSSPDLRAAREVTAALRALDPRDPLRYDFNLCHLGMDNRCRGKRFDPVCGSCALRPACVLYNSTRRSSQGRVESKVETVRRAR